MAASNSPCAGSPARTERNALQARNARAASPAAFRASGQGTKRAACRRAERSRVAPKQLSAFRAGNQLLTKIFMCIRTTNPKIYIEPPHNNDIFTINNFARIQKLLETKTSPSSEHIR
jgi:hypothetical protein